MMKHIRIITGLVVAVTVFPFVAQARTTLFLDGPAQAREHVDIPVVLRATLEESINAVRMTVRYDPTRVKITAVDDHDSAVRYWLALPHSSTSGSMSFEGVIPGGIAPGLTDTVALLRLTAQFLRAGPATLTIDDTTVYLNQPNPHEDEVTVRPLTVTVRPDAPEVAIIPAPASGKADVQLIREPTLNDGAWTLIFDVRTQEGTAQVRVRERWLGLFGAWQDTNSPYRLSDQWLTSIIDVGIASGSHTQVVRTIVPGRLQSIFAIVLLAAIVTAIRRFKRKG